MRVDLKTLVSITEANQNFSKIARMVDESGAAVIMKNNVPRYVIIDYNVLTEEYFAQDEMVNEAAAKYLTKHIEAFKELAKWKK